MTDEDHIDLLGRITALEFIVRGFMRGSALAHPDPQAYIRERMEVNISTLHAMAKNQGADGHPIVLAAVKWLGFLGEQVGTGIMLSEMDRHSAQDPAQVDRGGAGRKQ